MSILDDLRNTLFCFCRLSFEVPAGAYGLALIRITQDSGGVEVGLRVGYNARSL